MKKALQHSSSILSSFLLIFLFNIGNPIVLTLKEDIVLDVTEMAEEKSEKEKEKEEESKELYDLVSLESTNDENVPVWIHALALDYDLVSQRIPTPPPELN